MGEKRELDGWKMEEYFCVQGTGRYFTFSS